MGRVKKLMSSRLRSKEAHEKKSRHGLFRFILTVALALFAVFVAYSLITNQIAIRDNMRRYDELRTQTDQVLENNAQINGYLENEANLDEYIENIAREKLDYANADERIYIVIPASTE